MITKETKKEAQRFADNAIEKNSMINTDESSSLIDLENVDVDYQVISSNKERMDHWLPWAHKFISNAKSWVVGTHHGIESKYLSQYLAEYTFRCHDSDSFF